MILLLIHPQPGMIRVSRAASTIVHNSYGFAAFSD